MYDKKTIKQLDQLPGGVTPGDSLLVSRTEGGFDVPYQLEAAELQPAPMSPASFAGVRLYREATENLGAVSLAGGDWRLVGGLLMFSAVLTLPTLSGAVSAPPGASQRPFFIAPLPVSIMPANANRPVQLTGSLINTSNNAAITAADLVEVRGELLNLTGSGLINMTTFRLGVTELTGTNLVLRVSGVYHVGV